MFNSGQRNFAQRSTVSTDSRPTKVVNINIDVTDTYITNKTNNYPSQIFEPKASKFVDVYDTDFTPTLPGTYVLPITDEDALETIQTIKNSNSNQLNKLNAKFKRNSSKTLTILPKNNFLLTGYKFHNNDFALALKNGIENSKNNGGNILISATRNGSNVFLRMTSSGELIPYTNGSSGSTPQTMASTLPPEVVEITTPTPSRLGEIDPRGLFDIYPCCCPDGGCTLDDPVDADGIPNPEGLYPDGRWSEYNPCGYLYTTRSCNCSTSIEILEDGQETYRGYSGDSIFDSGSDNRPAGYRPCVETYSDGFTSEYENLTVATCTNIVERQNCYTIEIPLDPLGILGTLTQNRYVVKKTICTLIKTYCEKIVVHHYGTGCGCEGSPVCRCGVDKVCEGHPNCREQNTVAISTLDSGTYTIPISNNDGFQALISINEKLSNFGEQKSPILPNYTLNPISTKTINVQKTSHTIEGYSFPEKSFEKQLKKAFANAEINGGRVIVEAIRDGLPYNLAMTNDGLFVPYQTMQSSLPEEIPSNQPQDELLLLTPEGVFDLAPCCCDSDLTGCLPDGWDEGIGGEVPVPSSNSRYPPGRWSKDNPCGYLRTTKDCMCSVSITWENRNTGQTYEGYRGPRDDTFRYQPLPEGYVGCPSEYGDTVLDNATVAVCSNSTYVERCFTIQPPPFQMEPQEPPINLPPETICVTVDSFCQRTVVHHYGTGCGCPGSDVSWSRCRCGIDAICIGHPNCPPGTTGSKNTSQISSTTIDSVQSRRI